MNEYEFTVLYHPDLEIDIDKALAKIEKILKDNGATINKMDNWGKRKLAYTIKKQDHAVYVYYEIAMPGENVTKVENILNITDEVLRYLIAKPGPEIEEDEKSESTDSEDDSKESKSNDEEA